MSNINKTAVLNPLPALVDNIIDYIPRATTSKFGIVALGSGINVDNFGRIYLDTQEYSDRLAAIEAQAASSLATQKSEVAAAIAQVNLTQSQTITALTLEVSNLKTNLTDSITATQTDLINRADQLAQEVTDITVQLTQDKAAFTQEIQDALDYLKDDASVASALRTPRKINGTDFDGRSDITTNAWGAARTFKIGNKTNSINGTSNIAYSLADIGAFPDVGGTIQGNVEVTGNLSVGGTISATLEGTAARADKLQVARKIQGVDFDGTKDISLPTFTTQTDGLVPKRVGATTTKYLREDGTWVIPPDTTYPLLTKAIAEAGTATSANSISAKVLKDAINFHAPPVTDITGNAGTATKLQTPRTINGVLFDGTQNISLPEEAPYSLPTASDSVLGGIKVGSGLAIANSVLSVGTLNQSTTGNAATATKLQTARTISLTGSVTGSASFDGSINAAITTTITGLGVANGIATLDSSGQVPSTQLPSYVDDVLEFANVAAFPTTGESGKIYVETTGNTTYRWGGTGYVKITSGEVSSVAGKTGVVTLTKSDVGLANADNTTDSVKNVASATKLTTARTIGGVSFDGTANINLPGVNTTGNQSTTGNAATATSAAKWTTARTLTIGDSGKSVDGGGNVSWTRSDMGVPQMTTTTSVGIDNAESCIGYISNSLLGQMDGALYSHVYSDIWKHQIQGDYRTGQIALRGKNNGTWQAWRTVLDSGNYNDYSPTKTGTGASGSWGINITGNAASASVLQTARTINGVSFDGTSNITIAAETPSIATITSDATLASATTPGLYSVAGYTIAGLYNYGLLRVWSYGGVWNQMFISHNSSSNGSVAIRQSWNGTAAYNPWRVIDSPNVGGNAATASKLQTARMINGVSFDGTANISIADSTKVPLSGGTMTGNLNANALGVNNTASTGGLGLSLYGGATGGMPDYGLAFSGTATFGTHGSVVGDWATYFTMNGATNRGWIFKSGNGAGGNVASISANGVITGNQFRLTGIGDANYITNGNGDAASYSSHNMIIRSHWGIGFRDNQDVCRTVLDTRTGNFSTQGTIAAASVVVSGSVQVGGEIVTETGRISAPSSAYHYIDLGRDGADRQIFGSFGGVYYFRNSANNANVVTIDNGTMFCAGNITAGGNITAASFTGTFTGNVAIANGGTGATTAEAARTNLDVYSKAEVDSKNAVEFIPYLPLAYPKGTPPTGYLALMGQSISQATYPILYSLYGATLPDLRGQFLRGLDYGRGVDEGRVVLSAQEDAFKAHSHIYSSGDVGYRVNGGTQSSSSASPYNRTTGETGGTETRPKNIAFLYIVKAG